MHLYHVFIAYNIYFSDRYTLYTVIMVSGSEVINNGKTLHLKNLSYKVMAGTYKCTVTGIGGQNSGNNVLEVYCKYCSVVLQKRKKHYFFDKLA